MCRTPGMFPYLVWQQYLTRPCVYMFVAKRISMHLTPQFLCLVQEPQDFLCYIVLHLATVSSLLTTHSRRRTVHVFRRRIGSGEDFAFTNFSYNGTYGDFWPQYAYVDVQ